MKDIRPKFNTIYLILVTNNGRNSFSCHVCSYDTVRNILVKRLSFEGIYGLLHKNELNEKGKGLKSKEMRPTYDPYILH